IPAAREIVHLDRPSSNSILLGQTSINDFNVPPVPLCLTPNFVSTVTSHGSTNLSSMSTSSVEANNLAGTFSIQGSFTSGGPIFTTPEPDTNYQIVITPLDSDGGSPAAGAETVLFPLLRRQDGFTATVKTAPGGSVQANYSWLLTRVKPPPAF